MEREETTHDTETWDESMKMRRENKKGKNYWISERQNKQDKKAQNVTNNTKEEQTDQNEVR